MEENKYTRLPNNYYQCNYCNQIGGTYMSMVQHISKTHKGEKIK